MKSKVMALIFGESLNYKSGVVSFVLALEVTYFEVPTRALLAKVAMSRGKKIALPVTKNLRSLSYFKFTPKMRPKTFDFIFRPCNNLDKSNSVCKIQQEQWWSGLHWLTSHGYDRTWVRQKQIFTHYSFTTIPKRASFYLAWNIMFIGWQLSTVYSIGRSQVIENCCKE